MLSVDHELLNLPYVFSIADWRPPLNTRTGNSDYLTTWEYASVSRAAACFWSRHSDQGGGPWFVGHRTFFTASMLL